MNSIWRGKLKSYPKWWVTTLWPSSRILDLPKHGTLVGSTGPQNKGDYGLYIYKQSTPSDIVRLSSNRWDGMFTDFYFNHLSLPLLGLLTNFVEAESVNPFLSAGKVWPKGHLSCLNIVIHSLHIESHHASITQLICLADMSIFRCKISLLHCWQL